MKLTLIIALTALAAVVVADPPRPNPTDTFLAEVAVEQHRGDEHFLGEGFWAVDEQTNKAVEDYRLRSGLREVRIFELQRFDINEAFEIDTFDVNECRERAINGSATSFWGWLKDAVYIGKDIFHDAEVDLWAARTGGFELEMGVIAPEYNRPLFFRRRYHSEEFVARFNKFHNETSIDQKYFDIPSECQGAKVVKEKAMSHPIKVKVNDPPRPNPGNTFLAEVGVEQHRGDEHFIGEGFWGVDPQTNKAVEDYRLRSGLREVRVLNLFRFDIQEAFEIDTFDVNECRERVVNGSVTPFWGWLNDAVYIGKDIFHDAEVDLWAARTGGFELEMGVIAPEYNRPLFFRRRYHSEEFVARFNKYHNETTIDQKYFDIPSECQGARVAKPVVSKLRDDPPRPNFPENFFAEVSVESHSHNEHLVGEGIWGIDYSQSKAVEDYRLRSGLREVRVYELQRFDLQRAYEIDSENVNECRERVINGSMYPVWGWLKDAEYIGKDIVRHAEVDLWAYYFGGVELRVGVLAPEYNRPMFYARREAGHEIIYGFNKFENDTSPDPKHFVVPGECANAQRQPQAVKPVSGVQDPQRPVITETFEAELEVRVTHGTSTSVGKGKWGQDIDLQMSRIDMDVQEQHSKKDFRIFKLARYDKALEYEISSENRTECVEKALTGHMQKEFSWVEKAHFVNKVVDHENITLDVWRYATGGVELTLAVYAEDVNTPRFLSKKSAHLDEEFFMPIFAAQTPSPSIFTVPTECQ